MAHDDDDAPRGRETESPYRDGAGSYLACPRCGEALLASDESFVCSRDCGEWIEISKLRPIPLGTDLAPRRPGHTTTSEFPLSALRCTVCHRQMESRAWGNALFELCLAHGLWVAARFRSAFHLCLAAALDEEREARALADRLDTATPEGRLGLARRILLLERRLALLERRSPKD